MSPLVGDVDNAPYIDLGFARGARWKKMRELSTYCFTAAKLKQANIMLSITSIVK